jgi:hypothetical protein
VLVTFVVCPKRAKFLVDNFARQHKFRQKLCLMSSAVYVEQYFAVGVFIPRSRRTMNEVLVLMWNWGDDANVLMVSICRVTFVESCNCCVNYANTTFVVYYESIKRELKRRLTYEYRCDERLTTSCVTTQV